jgi:hypothetical protein
LGERIIESLNPMPREHGEPDLLTRWICHEVADALAAVNRARSARARSQAVQQAAHLVMLLWEHRSHWPSGWPPHQIRDQLAQLEPRTGPFDRDPEPSGSPWFDALRKLNAIGDTERLRFVQMGLIEQGVDDERAALDVAPRALAEDERDDVETMKRLVRIHDAATEWLQENNARTSAEVRDFLGREFRRLASARRRLVTDLLPSD